MASRVIERLRALPLGNRQPVPLPDEISMSFVQRVGNWFGWNNTIESSEGGLAWPMRTDQQVANDLMVAGIPAAWKCIGFLANAVASCAPPIEFDAKGVRIDDLQRSFVVNRPWSMLTPHEFWAMVVQSLLMDGNFIGIFIDLYPISGYPRQVFPVPPDQVTMILVDGMPVYGWMGESFAWDEVIHIRNGFMRPGSLWGMGCVQQFREALSNDLNMSAFGRTTFNSAAEASVVIQVDRPTIDGKEAEAVQQAWIDRHASGVRRPAVIPRSMTITPLSFSPADAQFLESRQFSVAEIAFMFLMDPTDLTAIIGGRSSQLTYANREQRELERLTHPVGHLIRRIEQSWNDLLPSKRSMSFNVERLLRTDTLARMQAEEIGLRNGIFTLNDVRNIERLPHYPYPWADEPFANPTSMAAEDAADSGPSTNGSVPPAPSDSAQSPTTEPSAEAV